MYETRTPLHLPPTHPIWRPSDPHKTIRLPSFSNTLTDNYGKIHSYAILSCSIHTKLSCNHPHLHRLQPYVFFLIHTQLSDNHPHPHKHPPTSFFDPHEDHPATILLHTRSPSVFLRIFCAFRTKLTTEPVVLQFSFFLGQRSSEKRCKGCLSLLEILRIFENDWQLIPLFSENVLQQHKHFS